MRPARFHFGRLHVVGQFTDKAEFLFRGLRTNVLLKHRDHLWGFFAVAPLSEYPDVFAGYLVKLAPEQAEEVGDLETHELASVTVPNAAVAKARFFLDVPHGLIAFQHVSSHVPVETFTSRFCEVLEEGLDRFFVNADIQLIEARFEFLEALGRLSRIDRLEVVLHPTNPRNDEWYRRTDERLKRLEIDKYKEVMEAARSGPGLNVTDDAEIRGKVVMAEDGYGEVAAHGMLEGKHTRISTKQNPVSTAIHLGELSLDSVYKGLKGAIDDIKRRFN